MKRSVLVVGYGWNEKVDPAKVNEDAAGNLVIFVNYPNIGPFTKEWLDRKAKLEEGQEIGAGTGECEAG